MSNIKQLQEPKQKYGLGIGYVKKALDLAIQINKVEEFISYLKNFIEEAKDDLLSIQNDAESILIGDPLHVPHKGQQPNRYKSSGEPSKKVRRKVPTNEDSEEIRQDIQNTTETSSNSQVSTLHDSEK
ncbi:8530_t:CDS:1, partial [Cetraspora pellucida]